MAFEPGYNEIKDEKKAEEDDHIPIHSLPLRIFHSDLVAKFICEQCGKVPLKMASCNEGHSFCRPCITQLCATKGVCPADQKPIIQTHLANPFLNNMISKEKVCCLYGSVKIQDNEGGNSTDKGGKCHWEGSVFQLITHLKDCKFEPIKCRFHEIGCNEQLVQNKIKSHYNDFNIAHQDLILSQIVQIKTEMKDLRSIVTTLGKNMQQQINGIKQSIEKSHEEKKEERSVIIAIGCNDRGELGRGDVDDCPIFSELKWSSDINISQIIACSKKAYCFMTDTKDIYVSGDNDEGQLGIDSEEDQWSAKLHPFFKFKNLKVNDVSRSILAKHIFFICDNNNIYCSGANYDGQLGMGNDENYCMPKLNKYFVSNNITITKIACGEFHSLFLSKSGAVYSCGSNKSNQLGYGTIQNKCQKTPDRIITFPNEIVDISAGRGHSYCLDINGNVWSFGSNDCGQLGINVRQHNENDEKIIHKIKFFENNGIFIVKILAGNYHGMALDKNGNVFVWGKGKEGQIGNGKTIDAFAPIKLNALNNVPIVDIFCGCNHNVCLSKDNRVFCWGNNRFGQCGKKVVDKYSVYDDDKFVSTPNEYYKIGQTGDKLICMAAGSYNMLLLLKKN